MKKWNLVNGDIFYDARFCSNLAEDVFGTETLIQTSGNAEMLNQSKLQFLRGESTVDNCVSSYFHCYFVSDLMKIRVKRETERVDRIERILLSHCKLLNRRRATINRKVQYSINNFIANM